MTKREARQIAQIAFDEQGNIEDAMVLVEDYGFTPEEFTMIEEAMQDIAEEM